MVDDESLTNIDRSAVNLGNEGGSSRNTDVRKALGASNLSSLNHSRKDPMGSRCSMAPAPYRTEPRKIHRRVINIEFVEILEGSTPGLVV